MGEAAEPRDRRETWRDWQAPDASSPPRLLSRAELLALLGRYNLTPPVDESDLRYWEYTGVLPRPIRQKYKGGVAAVYPIWMASVIIALRFHQGQGLTLTQIRPWLQAEARLASRAAGTADDGVPEARWLPPPPIIAYHHLEMSPLTDDMLTPEQRGELADGIRRAIDYLVFDDPTAPGGIGVQRSPLATRPVPIVRAQVLLIDANGRQLRVDVPLDE